MERKEQTTLGEALDEIVRVAQSLKQGQTSEFGGERFDMNEQVELHLEYAAHGEKELEFEIKFRQGATSGGQTGPGSEIGSTRDMGTSSQA